MKPLIFTNVFTTKHHMVAEANEAIRRIRILRIKRIIRNISSSDILRFFFSSSKGVTLRNMLRLSREYERSMNIHPFYLFRPGCAHSGAHTPLCLYVPLVEMNSVGGVICD